MGSVKRIALLMGHDIGYCRGVLRGIHAYAVDKANWLFHDAPPVLESLGPLREWQPHGIIAHLYDATFARRLLKLKHPLVNITSTFLDLSVPLIDVDNHLVGRLAAEHFLDRGFRNFGFFGSSCSGFSKQREEAFRDVLAVAGHAVTACYSEFLPRPPADASWKREERQVRDWLLAVAKPAAIFACHDRLARRLAEMCHQLEMRVPEDVALLGVDNDELECLLSRPPLSSVVNPSHKIGYEAARVLDQLMAGQGAQQRIHFVPPAHIVTRQSTDIIAVADAEVSAAAAFIAAHATENIRAADVVRHLAIARRSLELRFRKLLGRSMLQDIQRVRVESAKRLLAETDLPMRTVAIRSGFSTPQRLSAVFRQVTDEPPLAYRLRSRGAR